MCSYKKHDKGKYWKYYVVINDYFMQIINPSGKEPLLLENTLSTNT